MHERVKAMVRDSVLRKTMPNEKNLCLICSLCSLVSKQSGFTKLVVGSLLLKKWKTEGKKAKQCIEQLETFGWMGTTNAKKTCVQFTQFEVVGWKDPKGQIPSELAPKHLVEELDLHIFEKGPAQNMREKVVAKQCETWEQSNGF